MTRSASGDYIITVNKDLTGYAAVELTLCDRARTRVVLGLDRLTITPSTVSFQIKDSETIMLRGDVVRGQLNAKNSATDAPASNIFEIELDGTLREAVL